MISSCCTLRLKRRSALSIDSPSCTLTSATLEKHPLRGHLFSRTTLGIDSRDEPDRAGALWGPWSPTEYARLSQVNADSRQKALPASTKDPAPNPVSRSIPNLLILLPLLMPS